ncbi:MAG: hypothetical protein HY858_04630 [Candidatus Solibacter usitatus]|nr:hypothetical protein [Candidatus Solibacter usitatus]
MLNRRGFIAGAAAALVPASGQNRMTPKERVNRVLQGKTPDRAPFTFWHHFKDEKLPGLKHAASTLDFQRRFHLDIVKVMSDYPYPKGSGAQWYQLKEVRSPFPEQLQALSLIRDGLSGQKHFLETLFNPWNVAEKLSSKEAVAALMREKPQALLDALEAIARSQANHVRAALELGVSGIFLAIANAQTGILTPAGYAKFSEPFDRMVLAAAKDAPMNTLHLHGDKVYADRFWQGWPAQVINYSAHEIKVSPAEARRKCSAVLMCGLDHRSAATASAAEVQAMVDAARAAGPKWICAPGCSVPDESTDKDLLRLSRQLSAAS